MTRLAGEHAAAPVAADAGGADAAGVIETRGLYKSFGGTAVLSGVDVAFPEGSICALMGPSGTGKSVMIKHIPSLTSE